MTILPVVEPAEWPAPPTMLSFSAAAEIKTCPRRWALMHAKYLGIWERPGYPDQLSDASLEGSVIHLALSKILNAFTEAGCTSINSSLAVAILRELGGLSAVLSRAIESILASYVDNPRVRQRLPSVSNALALEMPNLRSRLQALLRRTLITTAGTAQPSSSGAHVRRELVPGTYSEIGLWAKDIGWHGIADLLRITERGCEIRDFKTGVPKDEHAFQLRVYALLWWRDFELNPNSLLASKLVASYEHEDREIAAPTTEELLHVERDLKGDSSLVADLLTVIPPPARPSLENCSYCPVRQQCQEYWSAEVQAKLYPTPPITPAYGDLQVRIRSTHGLSSWDGEIQCGYGFQPGTKLLLRTNGTLHELRPGQDLRILGVRISPDDGESQGATTIITTLSDRSEIFAL